MNTISRKRFMVFENAMNYHSLINRNEAHQVAMEAIRKTQTLLVCLFLLWLMPSGKLDAQGGIPAINPAFGTNGKIVFDTSLAIKFFPLDMIIQPDQKVILGGMATIKSSGNTGLVLYRYHENGQPDSTFANNGVAIVPLPDYCSYWGSFYDIKLSPSGKIMLLTKHCGKFGIAQLNPDGTPDTSMGNSYLLLTTSINESFNELAVQADNKILIFGVFDDQGSINGEKGCVRRYNPAGQKDNTYGLNGRVTFNSSLGKSLYLTEGVMQPDEKLVVTGYCGSGLSASFSATRLTQNGKLDISYNGTGSFTKVLGNNYHWSINYGIALQSDGKVLLAGQVPDSSVSVMGVMRLNTNGSPDLTFGNQGLAIAKFPIYAYAYDVAVQSDGKIILAGSSRQLYANVFALARFDNEGKLDHTFGENGSGMATFYPDFQYKSNYIANIEINSKNEILALSYSKLTTDSLNIGLKGDLFNYLTTQTTMAYGHPVRGSNTSLSAHIFPNPMNHGQGVVNFNLDRASAVNMNLYDSTGKYLANLYDDDQQAGNHSIGIDLPPGLASGVYFISISANGDVRSLPLQIE